ncbi:MAG: heparan-alpha-glucosaminide N-acetyltransferase [Pseudomonadota bacterium]
MSPPRIVALDLARAVALGAMAVYHFFFDLEMFGFVAPGTALSQPLRGLAICTAASFLALAGISLVLAQGSGLRVIPFVRRLGMIAAAALAITLGSYVWAPDIYIYFGILHCIALCSLLGLALLWLPGWALALGAAGAFVLPDNVTLSAPALLWTGLVAPIRPALDYVPLFPWSAAFLLGMAVGKFGRQAGLWARLADVQVPALVEWFAWPGRHSLAIYLIHQPVLIAMIWLASQVIA